jgi:lipoyl(octanoyl) transferase
METMNKPVFVETRYQFLERITFQQAWDLQEELFRKIEIKKIENQSGKTAEHHFTGNWLLFCEHPHVFTLGKSGDKNNLLLNALQLQNLDAQFVPVNRGGDITYHGPGQIVAYPILNLEYFVKGMKEYIHKLEEVVISMLQHYGVQGGRLNGATGVWLDPAVAGKARKICAIGVRTSRWISMHGLALNINTDLSYFNYINPCGFTDKQVTSLQKELGAPVAMEEARQKLKEAFCKVFDMNLVTEHHIV